MRSIAEIRKAYEAADADLDAVQKAYEEAVARRCQNPGPEAAKAEEESRTAFLKALRDRNQLQARALAALEAL